MSNESLARLLGQQAGQVTADVYSTAWVALVPSIEDPARPAWPQCLSYIRSQQLADGGWGDDSVYYAYDRTISTLAAIRALLVWQNAADRPRIARGVTALHRYAADLRHERYESIGFELLLPSFISSLEKYDLQLPLVAWSDVSAMTAGKLSLLGNLKIDYEDPRSWWFSMEMFPTQILGELDDRLLNQFGSVAVATSTTAAYLRARRLRGEDSPRAASYLAYVLHTGGGGVSQLWPIDSFELAWTVDAFLRAGLKVTHPLLAPVFSRLVTLWQTPPVGLSYSLSFPLNDGDGTTMGHHVLRWGGMDLPPAILRRFWNGEHFITYPQERNTSLSANVHALTALRYHVDEPEYAQLGNQTTAWLRGQMDADGALHDKWHLSPFYTTSRAILPFLSWDQALAQRCVNFLVSSQVASGGWGIAGAPNLEDTSHAVLGLITAYRAGLLPDDAPLRRASRYLRAMDEEEPGVRLWIGKVLYRPVGVIQAIRLAAKIALQLEGFWEREVEQQMPGLWFDDLGQPERVKPSNAQVGFLAD